MIPILTPAEMYEAERRFMAAAGLPSIRPGGRTRRARDDRDRHDRSGHNRLHARRAEANKKMNKILSHTEAQRHGEET